MFLLRKRAAFADKKNRAATDLHIVFSIYDGGKMFKRKRGLQMGAIPLKTSLRRAWQYTEGPATEHLFNHHCRGPPLVKTNQRFKCSRYKKL